MEERERRKEKLGEELEMYNFLTPSFLSFLISIFPKLIITHIEFDLIIKNTNPSGRVCRRGVRIFSSPTSTRLHVPTNRELM